MANMLERRNVVVEAFGDGLLNDEEFVLLYDLSSSRNLNIPYWQYRNFDLNNMQDDECISDSWRMINIPSFWCSRNTQLLQWVKTLWRYCALCSAQTIFLPLSLYGYGSSLWYGCSPTEHGMEQCDEFNKWLVVWFFAKFSISTVITLKFDNIL